MAVVVVGCQHLADLHVGSGELVWYVVLAMLQFNVCSVVVVVVVVFVVVFCFVLLMFTAADYGLVVRVRAFVCVCVRVCACVCVSVCLFLCLFVTKREITRARE